MICIKTGFNLIRTTHMDVLRGDLFVHGNSLIAVAHEHTSREFDPSAPKDQYTLIVNDDHQVLRTGVHVIDVNGDVFMTQSMYQTIDAHLDLGERQHLLVLPNMKI